MIVTTGYTAPQNHEYAYQSGADDVVVKPLDSDDFLQNILAATGMESALDSRPWCSQSGRFRERMRVAVKARC